MSIDKYIANDKDKTADQFSNSPSIDYPQYLDIIKFNLQVFLPAYSVSIISKESEQQEDQQFQNGSFSIIITSQKMHKSKFQIFTESFLDQKTYSFYVKHLITLNHNQLKIQNRQMISLSLHLCNKINSFLQYFKLVIHPVSGKIYFETKSLINQSSLNHLRKHIPKQDCYYTEVIVNSLKKAQKYIDLLLFILGQIQLDELLENQLILNQFSFFKQCKQILEGLEKNLFYVSFIDLDRKKQAKFIQKLSNLSSFTLQAERNWRQFNLEKDLKQKCEINRNQKKLSQAKSQIINNSLQYFSKNTQNILKIYTDKSPYQNVDFSQNPFQFEKISKSIGKTILQIDDKQSSLSKKKILSYIQIIDSQNQFLLEQQRQNWRLLSEGGFGIIELGTIKFKNLSASYTEPQTGFSFVIKQQMIRKKDKNPKKSKIQRQRRILQKLRFFAHPNIMSFYISFQNAYENCIFSDYTPNMSLDMYLKKNQLSISFDRKIYFLIQAIQGLKFLHQRKTVHLDIKPGNMLISKQLKLMLSDFGQAFIIDEDDPTTHNHAYTVPYCAPEIFLTKAELTQKVDIYAIGDRVSCKHFQKESLQNAYVEASYLILALKKNTPNHFQIQFQRQQAQFHQKPLVNKVIQDHLCLGFAKFLISAEIQFLFFCTELQKSQIRMRKPDEQIKIYLVIKIAFSIQ